MDVFKKIKRHRSNNNEDDVTIDWAAGDSIPEKCSEVHWDLYNQGFDDLEKVNQILINIMNTMGANEVYKLKKINSVTIKEGIEKIRANKSDPIHD